jgi:hypothetical protein
LTVPFTCILEWHILAHAGTCIPFLLFACTSTFWCSKLVHACAEYHYYYKLPNDTIVIAVIFTTPLAERRRRALFDVRRWRHALRCCCAEWERGYSYG